MNFATPEPMSERRRTYLRLIAEVSVSHRRRASRSRCSADPVVGILMPFILAFIMAWMFNPVIAWLQRHLRLTRRLFSYILVLVFYALLFGLCLFFAGQLDFAGRRSGAQRARLHRRFAGAVQRADHLAAGGADQAFPPNTPGVGDEIFSLLNSAWEWLKTLLSGALGYVMSISRNVALEVPNFVIFLTVLVLASCIITADFPNLRENIYGYLGVRGKNSVRLMGHSFRAAVFGFFRSQLIFALLDMGIILVAFFIIGVSYPLPIALVLAFLDFIPFFGAGTVLVPWGLICMAIGLFDMGWKLLLLYGILYIIRRIFEPRILGGATGFSSLQMLFSMYAGMRIAGVTGLVVAPIVWITGVNFFKTGVLDGVMQRYPLRRERHPQDRRAPRADQDTGAADRAPRSQERRKEKVVLLRKKERGITRLSLPVLPAAPGRAGFFALWDDNRPGGCYNGMHLKTDGYRFFPGGI